MNFFAGQNREAMRAAWRTAWRRRLDQLPLEPLHAQMVDLIDMHPEYHRQMTEVKPTAAESHSSDPGSTDAFLHLGLHMALREQLATDRPPGTRDVYRRLCKAAGEAHGAEHHMIEVLAQTLWEAQRAGRMPDEQLYLDALRML